MDPSGRLRGFFVAGTDTDAGKTFVCARLARLLGRVAAGRLSYLKPVQPGCTPFFPAWRALPGSVLL